MSLRNIVSLVLAGCGVAWQTAFAAGPEEPVDYVRDIKPILVKHCNACHGPQKQSSGLRLDQVGLAVEGGDRGAAVVPGHSEESLLFLAITGRGDVESMPFEEPALSAEDIARIRRWIDQGAGAPQDDYGQGRARRQSDHWAFQPIRRPAVPAVENSTQVDNPIDAFIVARLEREGLGLSAEADRVTLIRRLSLDLLGLPPSIAEVDAFLADHQPGAYERVVDRLLASPHYGERWGRHWLDLARYADSNGFTIDGPRSIWKYRDWVIDAINADLRFDQFVIEQLAGDLLPGAARDQVVATGFHRNTLVNEEGGTDDEQFRVDAVVDRANTTGTVFLGLTIGCAQCHEHKFDPIAQKEFYQFFAFFNNTEDVNTVVPELSLPNVAQAEEQQRLDLVAATATEALREYDAKIADGQDDWEQRVAAMPSVHWTVLDPVEFVSEAGAMITERDDKSLTVGGNGNIPANDTYRITADVDLPRITALRLEVLTGPDLPSNGPGLSDDGNFVLSEFSVSATPLQAPATPAGQPQSVDFATCVADWSQDGSAAEYCIDGDPKTGWSIGVKQGQGVANVDREVIFVPQQVMAHSGGLRLTVRIEQSSGDPKHLLGRFRILATSDAVDAQITPDSVRRLVAADRESRTPEQAVVLTAAYASTNADRRPLIDRVNEVTRLQKELVLAIPTSLVLREREEVRETHLMIRGDFLRKGARVRPDVPSVLPPLRAGIEQPNRLDLARWLVGADNPLTARVAANRHWQRFFGLGFVETENDFGLQGTLPTHPELLDWLADEFQRQDWSIKRLHRLIVTSVTYRQSSQATDTIRRQDQSNRLLARQSRLRFEAETVRDVWLAVSGRLSRQIGGPGVYPPQPDGINLLTQVSKAWPESHGEERYRRGMYTYFWRSNPYPFLSTFDAPNGTSACTRRARSNTPLQALTLSNGRTFVEIAQEFAVRIVEQGSGDDAGRVRFGYRVCLSREPDDFEIDRLTGFLNQQRASFAENSTEAEAAAPTGLLRAGIAPAEAAAWTAVARVLLNLDEFITRE
jgi:mono/diheme cytochrome c family protein